MFTGIVEETGSIRSLRLSGSSGKIAIRAKKVLGGTRIGDSIAVNGVCLTVVALEKDGFTADVMAETVRRPNHGDTKIGEKVNLERAMAADGRFGGHIVAGHIDVYLGQQIFFHLFWQPLWRTLASLSNASRCLSVLYCVMPDCAAKNSVRA